MPVRDGSGPTGQGPRTGRGLGNCRSETANTSQNLRSGTNRPYGWGRRIWNATFGRSLGRRRRRPGN
jgi:hypothetical protein